MRRSDTGLADTVGSSSLQLVLRSTVLLSVTVLLCTGLHARHTPSSSQPINSDEVSFSSPRGRPSIPAAVLGTDEERKDYLQYTAHSYGNIQFTLSNNGGFAVSRAVEEILDPFTGESIRSCIFPANSGIVFHLSGGLIVGCTTGYDTLVSDVEEFLANLSPLGDFRYRTIDGQRDFFSKEAFSGLDIICQYNDTITDSEAQPDPDLWDQRPHTPMGLQIDQTSMSWGVPGLEDFTLLNYRVSNVGEQYLSDCFVGIQFEAAVYHEFTPDYIPPGDDDLIGFLVNHPSPEGCGYDITNIAYTMDNNGDPIDGQFNHHSPLGAVGITILGGPVDSSIVNFNWWAGALYVSIQDTIIIPLPFGTWGPRPRATADEPFRSIGLELGVPIGDRNWYYLMSHPEFDYDQMAAAIDFSGAGWLPPVDTADDIADGEFSQAVLSTGPFDIGPGQTADFSIALVGGENVHHDPTAFERLFHPLSPWTYRNQLDFSDLALNTRWARWIYDNPGFDTDGDGYAGEFRMCNGETLWYEGDGIPDFRADMSPPGPIVTVTPHSNKLVVRWNGYYTETNIDPITRTVDFEGYRVYVGLDTRESSMSILASFDWENYNRYKLLHLPNGLFRWITEDLPLTLDTLKTIYNDTLFDPLIYTRFNPLIANDTIYSFERQGHNQHDLSLNSLSGIHKVYPDAHDPGADTLLWQEDDLTYEHGQPLPKFYEYEYVYDKLLATVPYYVSVTSFDFGFAPGGIPANESNILNNVIEAFAQVSADTVEALQLDAYVYPNPYRADEDYLERGFENRDRSGMRNRARRLHFANLPNVCKISIFSLDGDLVRELDHNFPEGGANAMHESWDFITRNAMLAMSGLYYYVIESEGRTQIGKFVIIM